jgi:hypothetical protein
MYFSTSVNYVLPYFASKKNPAILVSVLIPGTHAFLETMNLDRFSTRTLPSTLTQTLSETRTLILTPGNPI